MTLDRQKWGDVTQSLVCLILIPAYEERWHHVCMYACKRAPGTGIAGIRSPRYACVKKDHEGASPPMSSASQRATSATLRTPISLLPNLRSGLKSRSPCATFAPA